MLGLIGLLATLVVVRTEALFAGVGERPLPDLLRLAVREARYQAANLKEPVSLHWDASAAGFVVRDGQGEVVAEFPSDREGDGLHVAFQRVLPEEGTTVRVRNPRYASVDSVVFHPDRTSHPFAVRLGVGSETSTHRYDPFSDAELDTEGGR